MKEFEVRTFNGEMNNIDNSDWGKAGIPLLRKAFVAYSDAKETPALRCNNDLCHPRSVSNVLCKEDSVVENDANLSNFIWAWGQFLDHEIDISPESEKNKDNNPIEIPRDIKIPMGVKCPARIPFKRSEAEKDSNGIRQQINALSAYIDGANVYGADCTRAAALRTFDGTGRLKVRTTDKGDLLPYNQAGFPNAIPEGAPHDQFFLAGDIRCNENSILTSMHTLFVREHNRLCVDIQNNDNSLTGNDERIYQMARKLVGAYMQQITFNEFLPAILGDNSIPAYDGYDPTVNASITNEFSTAFYRLGHSMLTENVHLGSDGNSVLLRELFFQPQQVENNGISPYLEGLVQGKMRRIDLEIVDSVREFLFGGPGSNKMTFLDLAVLNIQRGRDHGLGGYNACRKAYGLGEYTSFSDITNDLGVPLKLKKVYGDIDNIDPWIGGLAEDHIEGAQVGPLISAALVDQFSRLRDGDRFWWQNDRAFNCDGPLYQFVNDVKKITLGKIVKRNTDIVDISDDVFRVSS